MSLEDALKLADEIEEIEDRPSDVEFMECIVALRDALRERAVIVQPNKEA